MVSKGNNYTKIWNRAYGEILAKRAKGILPEMESSKAVSELLSKQIMPNDKILDVGCGIGHYYVSLKKKIKYPFQYYGIDIKSSYIRNAKKIFAKEKNITFEEGDVYDISFKDGFFDIVMFNNTLENLPSIEKPISELIRVTKKYVLIRALVDKRSFYIKEARDENFKNGEPKNFSYLNIYSRKYLKKVILKCCSKCKITFKKDDNFNPIAILRSLKKDGKNSFINPTNIIDKMQVNGPILMNWEFIEIFKN